MKQNPISSEDTGTSVTRCDWASSVFSVPYHDEEWGVPVHGDRLLFEMLTLEGAQAGLSWETILRKRDRYRRVFANFDPQNVARFSEEDAQRLLTDPGIVRNRLKVQSAILNAHGVLRVQDEHGSFDAFLWQFVKGRPQQTHHRTLQDIPNRSPEADRLSVELKRLGFHFVGPTICYAFMQAVGMVNDHLIHCFRHAELGGS